MFTHTLLAAALAVSAVPALADGIPAGEIQQARLLGVEPGVYTAAQLVRLDQAVSENDAETVRFILASPGGETVSSQGAASVAAGEAQFARILGVEPGALSASDLVRLETAYSENDAETARAILNGSLHSVSVERAAVSPGKAQLAASLGVDPAAYTTAELAAMVSADAD